VGNLRTIGFIGLGLATVFGVSRLFRGVRTQDAGTRMSMDVVSVDLLRLERTEVLFRINTRISNPSNQKLHLNFVNLTGKLSSGGTIFIIREDNLGTRYPIEGNSVKIIPLHARVGLVNLGITAGQALVKALIIKKGLPSSIGMTGEIKVNGFPQSINKTVPFNFS